MITVILVGAAALVVLGLIVMVMLNGNRKGPRSVSAAEQPVNGRDLRGSVRSASGDQ